MYFVSKQFGIAFQVMVLSVSARLDVSYGAIAGTSFRNYGPLSDYFLLTVASLSLTSTMALKCSLVSYVR